MESASKPAIAQPPYWRWFWYLAICSALALFSPYSTNRDDRYHSPGIRFYVEKNGKQVPATEKIWIDGILYAQHQTAPDWLKLAFLLVGVETVVFIIRRWRVRRS